MATAIPMPALSPTMKEGKLTRWLKKEGDAVSSGEAIAECETDKSNLEVEAYEEGTLLKILVAEGQSAPVGAPIAYLGEKGEKVEVPPQAPAAVAPPRPPPSSPPAAPPPRARPAAPPAGQRVHASPLARSIAEERGIDLAGVRGSGPQGRIVKRDLERIAPGAPEPEAATPRRAPLPAGAPGPRPEPEAVPLSTLRKVIAQRLTSVKPGVPHFYLSIEVEMEAALAVREEAKAAGEKISVNDVIVKAVAVALRRSPKVNVQLQGDLLLQLHTADVAIAVALDEGLIAPVIRDADRKGLAAIAAESRELAERARRRALRPEEYSGGSITVSNLGMYGIHEFIAVINPPQASILAVGAAAERPVVRGGQLAIRKMMSVTFSGDHRVIDGAIGAQYLQELKALLEHPARLLF